MKLLGLSGYARSGKDTAYELLREDGWQRISFAEPMRKFLYALNPIVGMEHTVGSSLKLQEVRVQKVIDTYGWDGYKTSPYGTEMRELMQRLGTACGREILGANIWVDTALNNLPNGRYVVTDCRFLNEAEAIRDSEGWVVRINRKGIGPANEHVSETGLDGYEFDAVVNNDSSLEEFKGELKKIVEKI